jgi:hypothetical protein
MESRLWSIVLAADAERTFSTSVEQTLVRLAEFCSASRTVIVLNEAQRQRLRELSEARRSAQMVFQPQDRGTAAGVLFGLLPVLTTDPEAVVLVTRSSQAVENTRAFHQSITDAVSYARRRFAVLLFGMESASERAGNEVVIVAQARALLHLCRQRLPAVSAVFVAALTMPFEAQRRYLSIQYPQLPSRDLQHLLTATGRPAHSAWPPAVLWAEDLASPVKPDGSLRTAEARPPHRRVTARRPPIAVRESIARRVMVWK